MEIKTRNYKLDALKMCLIVLVIFGHIPLLDGFIDLYLPGNYDYMTMHAIKVFMLFICHCLLCFQDILQDKKR